MNTVTEATRPAAARPTLARIATGMPAKTAEEIAAIYASGVFADPKPQRGLFTNREMVTDGHRRQVLALREECQALYANSRNLRQRINKAEEKITNLHFDLIDARQAMQSQHASLDIIKGELEEANRSLAEMDDLMRQSRSKRLSRMSAIINDDASHVVGSKNETRVEGVGVAQ